MRDDNNNNNNKIIIKIIIIIILLLLYSCFLDVSAIIRVRDPSSEILQN